MTDMSKIVEEHLPTIESQIGIMVAVHYNLEPYKDDLISDATIKAFRLVEQYLEKKADFNRQFTNSLRNVCRQVTWDFLRKEHLSGHKTRTLYDQHEDNFQFPDLSNTVESDILDSCEDERDAAIVSRRAAGQTQRQIAEDLNITRSKLIYRLKKIRERYAWIQIERKHGRITIRETS